MELSCKFYNGMDSSVCVCVCVCVCVSHLVCNFKAGYPIVFQHSYVITVDTIKYINV